MQNKNIATDKLIIARVPYSLWKSIKQLSLDEEISINSIVKDLLIGYMNKANKRNGKSLTNNDKMIT